MCCVVCLLLFLFFFSILLLMLVWCLGSKSCVRHICYVKSELFDNKTWTIHIWNSVSSIQYDYLMTMITVRFIQMCRFSIFMLQFASYFSCWLFFFSPNAVNFMVFGACAPNIIWIHQIVRRLNYNIDITQISIERLSTLRQTFCRGCVCMCVCVAA